MNVAVVVNPQPAKNQTKPPIPQWASLRMLGAQASAVPRCRWRGTAVAGGSTFFATWADRRADPQAIYLAAYR
jgi:hypothetical protein